MRKLLESEIKGGILARLSLVNRSVGVFWKQPTVGIPDAKVKGGFRKSGQRGISDILGCYKGRLICIEVKRPGNKATPEQIRFLEAIERTGGYSCIMYDADEVDDLLKKLEADNGRDKAGN